MIPLARINSRLWQLASSSPEKQETDSIPRQSNRNPEENGREQDSCGTRNQYFVQPVAYHIPLRGSECQRERAPA